MEPNEDLLIIDIGYFAREFDSTCFIFFSELFKSKNLAIVTIHISIPIKGVTIVFGLYIDQRLERQSPRFNKPSTLFKLRSATCKDQQIVICPPDTNKKMGRWCIYFLR